MAAWSAVGGVGRVVGAGRAAAAEEGSGAFALSRVASGCPIGRRCRGSCSCCTPGSPWMHLPQELGFGSGYTCWRRLEEWQRAGVWEQLHALLLARLRAAARSSGRGRSSTPATCRRKRGLRNGPEPGRPGQSRLQAPSPRRRDGIPLAWTLTGGNRNDVTQLIPLLDRVPAGRRRCVGRPRRRPDRSSATAATTTTSTAGSSASAASNP